MNFSGSLCEAKDKINFSVTKIEKVARSKIYESRKEERREGNEGSSHFFDADKTLFIDGIVCAYWHGSFQTAELVMAIPLGIYERN